MDWVCAYIVPLYKGKGDVYECGNSRVWWGKCIVEFGLIGLGIKQCEISEVQSGFRRACVCVQISFL